MRRRRTVAAGKPCTGARPVRAWWRTVCVVFERFTDRARRVVVLAQEEARLLNHNYIGTEHILLGLIHEGDGVAAKALQSLGISLEAVRAQVEQIIGNGGHAPSGHIPFTPRAKTVLELSLREALQLRHNYIGTEHILLGLIREGEGVGAQVLGNLGADLSRVRQQVVQLLSGGAESDRVFRAHDASGPQVGLSPQQGRGITAAVCGFCGVPSPECGALFTGVSGALICERCLQVGAAGRVRRGARVVHTTFGAVPVGEDESSTLEELAARFEPSGEAPEDEPAARREIAYVFSNHLERGDDGHSLRNVEDGENLGDCADQVIARYGRIRDQTIQHIDQILFLNATEAVVWWTSQIDGQPIGGFHRREGRALLIAGTWKVSRATLCSVFQIAGVVCPPPPSKDDTSSE